MSKTWNFADEPLVQDPLAKKILHGEVVDGNKVSVDAEQNELKFTVDGRSGDSQWKSPSHNAPVQQQKV